MVFVEEESCNKKIPLFFLSSFYQSFTDSPETMYEILTIFLQSIPGIMEELRCSMDYCSFEACGRNLHTLTNNLAAVSQNQLGDISSNMEYLCSEGDFNRVRREFRILQPLVTALCKEAQRVLDSEMV